MFNSEQKYEIKTKIIQIEKYLKNLNLELKSAMNRDFGNSLNEQMKNIYFGGKTNAFDFSGNGYHSKFDCGLDDKQIFKDCNFKVGNKCYDTDESNENCSFKILKIKKKTGGDKK